MAVTGALSVSIEAKNQATSDSESAEIKTARALSQLFTDGTGAGQINKMWQDIRPLTDGGNEALDISPTPTSGVTGAVTFSAIKALLIWAPTTNTTNLTISRAATTGAAIFGADGDALAPLKPGGVFLLTDPSAAGIPVAAGDTDVITITNSAGAAATYGIVVLGI